MKPCVCCAAYVQGDVISLQPLQANVVTHVTTRSDPLQLQLPHERAVGVEVVVQEIQVNLPVSVA